MSWRGIFRKAGIAIDGNTFTFSKNKDVVIRPTDSNTTGTLRGLNVAMNTTGAATANMVEALRASITSDVKTGVWANAIVGSIDYSDTGAAHGMAAAICAEMIPPDGTLARGALYSLDCVFGCGSSSTWSSAGPVAFIRFENWGTAAHFSANAFLFHVVGETGATGGLLSLNSRTLRVRIGSTTKYLYLSDTEDDLGAMVVDSIVLSSATTTGITLSGTMTTGISITGATGDAISITTGGKVAIGTQGSGLPVTTAAPHLVQVHTLPVVALDAYTSSFGIRSRYEISTNQTNNITIHAIDGRFRPKANIATGIFAGVCGYVEGSDTWSYIGSADSVIAAGLFTVELDNTATLTSGRVIGIGIDSASAGDTVVTNCTYTGLRIWTGSGKEPWTYGITVTGCVTGLAITAATGDAISIVTSGRVAIGTQGSGLPVTTANPHLVQVHTMPVVALTAYTSSFGFRSRYEISTNQTNSPITIHAIDGRFRPKANIAEGVFAGVCGYVEGSDTWTYAGSTDSVIAAGLFTVELDSTASLNSGRVIGVGIDSASAGDTSVGSVTYTGLRIWVGSSKEPWTYGITIDDCVTGILIADTASVMTTGIQISGPTTTGLYISGYAPTGIRVGGVCNASIANLKSLYLETTVGNSGVLTGYMTGIHIETYVGSVPTVPEHYGILVQTYSDLAGNQDIFPLRLDHNGASVAYAFMSLNGSPRYFVQSANTAEAWCSNAAVTASTGGGWLRVRLGGTDRYINLYSDVPS